MATYTLKLCKDDENTWEVEGLPSRFIVGRQQIVFIDLNDTSRTEAEHFRDAVASIKRFNPSVIDGDVFITPEGQYVVKGSVAIPCDPQPKSDVVNPPVQSNPVLQKVTFPVIGFYAGGKVFTAILSLAPNATSSDIVAEWDKVSNSPTPGDIIASIRIPGTDERIIEIEYDNKCRVVIEVG